MATFTSCLLSMQQWSDATEYSQRFLSFHVSMKLCVSEMKTSWLYIVIVISKLLKHHSKSQAQGTSLFTSADILLCKLLSSSINSHANTLCWTLSSVYTKNQSIIKKVAHYALLYPATITTNVFGHFRPNSFLVIFVIVDTYFIGPYKNYVML